MIDNKPMIKVEAKISVLFSSSSLKGTCVRDLHLLGSLRWKCDSLGRYWKSEKACWLRGMNIFAAPFEAECGRVIISLGPNLMKWSSVILTHWGRERMAAISQTTYSNAFLWMKIYEFRLKFHWSLFPRVQLTIFQHWFRWWLGADQATSHYLNQWWSDYRPIYASLGLNELILCHQFI